MEHSEIQASGVDPLTGRSVTRLVAVTMKPTVVAWDDTPPAPEIQEIGHLRIQPTGDDVYVVGETGQKVAGMDVAPPGTIRERHYRTDLDTGERTVIQKPKRGGGGGKKKKPRPPKGRGTNRAKRDRSKRWPSGRKERR